MTKGKQLPLKSFKGIKKIESHAKKTVPVLFLAIEPNIKSGHTDPCKYDKAQKDNCIKSPQKFAHFYISGDKKESVEHYIVLFVGNEDIRKTNSLADILWHTAQWLHIEEKEPHFYVFFFTYDGTSPSMSLVSNPDLKKWTKCEIEKFLKNKKDGKNKKYKCSTDPVRKDAEIFTIYPLEAKDPYSFNVNGCSNNARMRKNIKARR
jgi:hypothetical protein